MVLLRVYVEAYRYHEMASIVDVSIDTTMSRIARGALARQLTLRGAPDLKLTPNATGVLALGLEQSMLVAYVESRLDAAQVAGIVATYS